LGLAADFFFSRVDEGVLVMAAITAQAVKELRDLTDLPMMDVKKALVDADGDQARAIELLKERNKK